MTRGSGGDEMDSVACQWDPLPEIATRCGLLHQPTHTYDVIGTVFNPLECKGNCSATSNNMKLVHWPLIVDGWAVTFGTARRELVGVAARPGFSSLYQMLLPTHQRPVYRSPYCTIMVRWSAVLMCLYVIKVLNLAFYIFIKFYNTTLFTFR